MEAIIDTLLKAPISTILVLAGISFLLPALVGQVPGKIEVLPAHRKWAAIVGATLLVLGIALYLPSVSQPDSDSTAGQPAAPGPTSTLTSPPTVTSVPLPSPPDVKTWRPVAIDDFSNEDTSIALGWSTGVFTDEYRVTNLSIQNAYRMGITFNVDNWIALQRPVNVEPVDDFYAKVEAKKLRGYGDLRYGLALRVTTHGVNPDFYSLEVEETTKRFAFFLHHNGRVTALRNWTHHTAIQKDAVNELAVIAKGAHFDLYINNMYVDEVDDTTITSGLTYLLVEVANKQDVIVEFDNFELRVPKK